MIQVSNLKRVFEYGDIQTVALGGINMEISDGDIKNAKLRMTRLVREVNRCIGLLNAEEVAVDEQGENTQP